MQTLQITVTVGDNSQTFEVEISDLNFCDIVQRAGCPEPERHDEAICSLAAEKLIEHFAPLAD